MEEKVVRFDLVAVAERFVKNWEVRTRRDGTQINYPFWTVDEMLEALPVFEAAAEPNTTVDLLGVAPAWVMGVIIGMAYPKAVNFRRDEHAFVSTTSLRMAEKGEGINPDAEIEFTVETEGDKVFITYKADDISKPFTSGHHNYNMDKLPEVVTPYVSSDSHIYLRGSAAYPVSMSILSSYFNKCKSISILDHDQPFYTCVACYSDERRIGDRLPGEDVAR